MKKHLLLLLLAGILNVKSFGQLTVSLVTTNTSCLNPSGTIKPIVSGGSGTVVYTWSNGSTDSVLTNLSAGHYCVTVFDMLACRASAGIICFATACADVGTDGPPMSCSIKSNPNAGAISSGLDPNTIYLGYGPQSTHLTATASLPGPYTYSWAPASQLSCSTCASPDFAPTAEGMYTFSVTITSSGKCPSTSQCTLTICVLDVTSSSCGNGNKVYLCHYPPGNAGNPQTLCISASAVPAHLRNHAGDHVGRCDQVCGSSKRDDDVPELVASDDNEESDIIIYPNPSTDGFHLKIETPHPTTYQLTLFDVTGKVVEELSSINPSTEISVGSNIARGIYFIRLSQGNVYKTFRLVKQ